MFPVLAALALGLWLASRPAAGRARSAAVMKEAHRFFVFRAPGWMAGLRWASLLLLVGILPGAEIANSDCLQCHAGVQLARVHDPVTCQQCHSDIQELPHSTPVQPIDCLKCHRGMADTWGSDPHLRARAQGNKNAPDCKTCHGTHNLRTWKIERSAQPEEHRKSVQAFCSTCHAFIKAPEGYHLWPGIKNEDCLKCHADPTRRGTPGINPGTFRASVHGNNRCTECHRDVNAVPHPRKNAPVDCGVCHLPEYTQHKESVHGQALAEGISDAAHCWDCHGSHDVRRTASRASRVSPLNLPDTCGKCHARPGLAEKYRIPVRNPIALFKMSVHYKAIQQGERAAVCNECHGVHDIQPLENPKSRIYKGSVPQTCGACHSSEYQRYTASTHWRGYLKGARDAPVCNDCHQEHAILQPSDPSSPVFAGQIPETCTRCHESEIITSRYGIETMTKESYFKSYHGLALKAGKVTAANCASCHRAHDILPSSDPASSTNPANLAVTCGTCHPGIGSEKSPPRIHGKTKKTPATAKEALVSLVRRIYIVLIIVVIGGMAVHNLFHFVHAVRRRRKGPGV